MGALRNLINSEEEKEKVQYFSLFSNGNELKIIAVAKYDSPIGMTASIINKHLDQMMKSINDILGYKINLKIECGYNNMFAWISQKKPFSININKQIDDTKIALGPKEYERLINKYKLFMSNINDGDIAAIMSLIDTFMDEIQTLPLQYIHRLIIDLLSNLTNRFMELNANIWEMITKKVDYHHLSSLCDII